MRRSITLLIAVGVVSFTASTASAHAILTDSYPARGSIVNSLPAKVWLEFDGNLTQIGTNKINFITITDSRGKIIPNLKDYVGGARITAELAASKVTGKVVMSWRVVSEDGHPISGSIYFYVLPKKIGK